MKQRIKNLQSFLKEGEAGLVFCASNRFYLTGFQSSAGVVVLTQKTAVLLIDFRYIEKAKSVVSSVETRLLTDSKKQIKEIFEKDKITKVFLETDYLDIAKYESLCKDFEDIEISRESDFSKKIKSFREIKTEREITLIKSAQEITDKAFSYILERISVGRTEKEIALDLEFFMRKNGAEAMSFDIIAVSGKNSSLPHGVPTDKPLENGDFLTMDFGAKFGGYCSDMTRTVAIGEVSQKQREVYETVLKAQELAFEKIKPNIVCKDVDSAARDYIYGQGFENCFGHGLGHSVGIDIHENPRFNTSDNTVLKNGMVLTVEPGIYLENEFGVRIENMVLVTDGGYENLTKSPKDLIII